ncbi:hypothetical protein IFM89_006394 [Coptis chinensis]|uniref:indole-3-pyruvate monooxygenase n=1 Tax=Coptis chinensis TaxID=261450 RepID=A0A835HP13_9MAGN|nr:hypothetical protein IFM89_006394 [Coptis chinensis]
MLFVDCLREVESKRVHDPFDETMKKNGRCVLVQGPIIVGASLSSCSPTYPTKEHFVDYLDAYVSKFGLEPQFNQTVESVAYDHTLGSWRVKTVGLEEISYLSRWLVVATGENSEAVVLAIEGMNDFEGPVLHTSSYKNGEEFFGKNVLVVGCGNFGMEI